jgi:dCTP deaminase
MIQPDYRLRVIGYECIRPYDPNLINPASIDLRLGNIIRQPRWVWRNPVTRPLAWALSPKDPRSNPDQFWAKAVEFENFTLWPGQFVLCHSLEEVSIPLNHVGILYSKSSTGRVGLEHLHAGYADPGFCGQLTFEFSNMAPWPVRLTAGQPLMQIVFEQLNGRPDKSYAVTGRYQGQAGPTAARQEKFFTGNGS